jgi:dolichyl-phosphate-mannose-protein mannosyltransferase
LGAIYSVAGHDVPAVRVCQAALGSISCALVAHAAWRLFSKRAGIIAGLILALYPPAIFFDGLLQKTALDVFLTSLAIWIISGLIVSPSASRRSWFALGATMGVLSLTRENALILTGVIVVWCLVGPFVRRPEGRPLPQTTDDVGSDVGRGRPLRRPNIAGLDRSQRSNWKLNKQSIAIRGLGFSSGTLGRKLRLGIRTRSVLIIACHAEARGRRCAKAGAKGVSAPDP